MDTFGITPQLPAIPKPFAPALLDPGLNKTIAEAKALVRQAASPWETVELPSAGGIQPKDEMWDCASPPRRSGQRT
jgi:hypothetical protein